jgi:hypothetical protein
MAQSDEPAPKSAGRLAAEQRIADARSELAEALEVGRAEAIAASPPTGLNMGDLLEPKTERVALARVELKAAEAALPWSIAADLIDPADA